MHDYFCICADNAANGKELAALLKHSGKCCGYAAHTSSGRWNVHLCQFLTEPLAVLPP